MDKANDNGEWIIAEHGLHRTTPYDANTPVYNWKEHINLLLIVLFGMVAISFLMGADHGFNQVEEQHKKDRLQAWCNIHPLGIVCKDLDSTK